MGMIRAEEVEVAALVDTTNVVVVVAGIGEVETLSIEGAITISMGTSKLTTTTMRRWKNVCMLSRGVAEVVVIWGMLTKSQIHPIREGVEACSIVISQTTTHHTVPKTVAVVGVAEVNKVITMSATETNTSITRILSEMTTE